LTKRGEKERKEAEKREKRKRKEAKCGGKKRPLRGYTLGEEREASAQRGALLPQKGVKCH